MADISRVGPVVPPNDPRGGNPLGQALDSYAKLLGHPTSNDLEMIAQRTVELSKLAKSVMHAASPALRTTAGDLEHLLQSPYSTEHHTVSLLKASEDYLQDHGNAELPELIQELCHNQLALGLMCNELSLLSGTIKNPNALGG